MPPRRCSSRQRRDWARRRHRRTRETDAIGMFRAIVFLVVVIVVAAAIGWVGVRPGEVSVVWLGHHIDAPIRVLLLAAFLLVAIAILMWSLWRLVTRSPRQFARARSDGRRRKA